MKISISKKSAQDCSLSPYSPSKKYNSPNKENLVGTESPSNGGYLRDDQIKEGSSPILSFQSPGAANYQSVPAANSRMKDSKLSSGYDKNSITNSFSRHSIGGGNTENFRTLRPAAAYADEPQLDMIEEY